MGMSEGRYVSHTMHSTMDRARDVLELLERQGMTLALAESCTGGHIASLLTDQEGVSNRIDRGFVTYSDEAKVEMLGIPQDVIARCSAVSAEVAALMATGTLERSQADIVAAVTGFAGPAGPGDEPGLVFVSVVTRWSDVTTRECHFGDIGRDRIRERATDCALELIAAAANAAKRRH